MFYLCLVIKGYRNILILINVHMYLHRYICSYQHTFASTSSPWSKQKLQNFSTTHTKVLSSLNYSNIHKAGTLILLGEIHAYCWTFWHRSFTFNSNKSPTWCNNFSVYYPDVCLQLKRQDNKLKNCCIRLVIYLNCTMMHGLTNLKFYI